MSYQGFPGTHLCWELQKRILKNNEFDNDKSLEFKLLYKASQNKCGVVPFNKHCLDKGQTLTVLYGRTGTIYGGYTSKSWTATYLRKYVEDPSAFLFSCNNTKSLRIYEMEKQHRGWAICCRKDWGPSFGGGRWNAFDLQVFKGNGEIKKNAEGYFPLNGSINFNCTYKDGGDQISNENLYVSDVEVYAVSKGSSFINDTVNDCKARMSRLFDETCKDGLDAEYNILLVGPIGVGKTSLCRTINAVFSGTEGVPLIGPIGRSNVGESVTSKIRRLTIQPISGCTINIYDNKGFSNDEEIENELENLLEGNMTDDYKAISTKNVEYLKQKDRRRIHAVCMVLDSTKIKVLAKDIVRKLQMIVKTTNKKGLEVTIVATRVDEACPVFKKEKEAIRKNSVIRWLQKDISDLTGINEKDIFPVINYTDETKTDVIGNMLVMRTLERLVNQAHVFYDKGNSFARHMISSANEMLSSINKVINVLCIGRSGAGKSWFIDNVLSTLRDQQVYQASGGLMREGAMVVGQSGTRQLNRHTLQITDECKHMLKTNVHFLDMPGYDKGNGVDAEKIRKVIYGHCPEGYDLLNQGLDTGDDAYIQEPILRNRVHVICFIIDDKSLQTPDVEQKMQHNILSNIVVPKRIPYFVVLTKPYKIKKMSAGNAIENVARTFGIRTDLIHVVHRLQKGEHDESVVDNRVLRLVAEIMFVGIKNYDDNYREEYQESM